MKRCERNHIGGPGLRVGRGCVHAGPTAAAVALGIVTGAAAASNSGMPWWAVLVSGLFWPAFSLVGQWRS